MNLIIELSKLNLDLSKKEALILLGNPKHKLVKNYLQIEMPNAQSALKKISKSAFSKAVYQTKFKLKKTDKVRLDIITIERRPDIKEGLEIIKGIKVDLKLFNKQICLLGFKKTIPALKIWENRQKFDERKSHRLPKSHPTGIDPRVARAMLNLTTSNEVTDPFCGAGGILIEGLLIKKKMKGIDVDPKMITRAKENLKHFGLECLLKVADSTSISIKDSIVCDIPYGVNSSITQTQDKIIQWLFRQKTKEIVICTNKTIRARNSFTKEFSTQIRIHKSLTRHIYLFKAR